MKFKKILHTLLGRLFITCLALVLQVIWLVYSVYFLSVYSRMINFFLTLLSFLAVIYIINGRSNPAVKLAWIVPILAFPILGGFLFLISGGKGPKRKIACSVAKQHSRCVKELPDCSENLNRIDDPNLQGQGRYLARQNFPIYANTQAQYYPIGEDGYAALLEELKKAEKFIFLEYFIVHTGKMWDSILEILTHKASLGVDVRVMYDDIGSVSTLPPHYYKQLEAAGIQAVAFNPFIPIISTIMNNRDHRKIAVIDGNVAFTGGVNLSDEYINEVVRFGHWKDSMVKLTGDGVWSMTLMFLEQWDAVRNSYDDLSKYRPTLSVPSDGYVQPYCDSPLDDEYLGENVYLNMINGAKRYVYITTPYLIVDSEMKTALCLAAKRGVDVQIITPGIPDKKIVWDLTRSYYPELLSAGVRIYEYTPGFIHSKLCICDDEAAVTGTINFDYRSLYLHFENACLFIYNAVVLQAKDDFLRTQEKSAQILLEDMGDLKKYRSLLRSIYYAVLRLFAPLL